MGPSSVCGGGSAAIVRVASAALRPASFGPAHPVVSARRDGPLRRLRVEHGSRADAAPLPVVPAHRHRLDPRAGGSPSAPRSTAGRARMATLVPDDDGPPGDPGVFVALYDLTEADERALDAWEGADSRPLPAGAPAGAHPDRRRGRLRLRARRLRGRPALGPAPGRDRRRRRGRRRARPTTSPRCARGSAAPPSDAPSPRSWSWQATRRIAAVCRRAMDRGYGDRRGQRAAVLATIAAGRR